MNIKEKITHFLDTFKFIVLALAIIVLGAFVVFAAPPDSQYEPGSTLDPTCAPGTPNCTVKNVSTADYFTASSSSATSTFYGPVELGNLLYSSSTATSTFSNGFNILSGCFAVNGICITSSSGSSFSTTSADYWLTTKTTDDVTEGSTNRYFSDSLARAALSSTATGLTYNSGTGAFSLTAGYSIPLTASTTEWASLVSSQWTTSDSNIYYNSGNVGVGTTSPFAKLSVTGDSYFDGNLTTTGYINSGSFVAANATTTGRNSISELCFSGSGNCYTEMTGLSGGTDYYLRNTASDVAGYEVLSRTPNAGVENNDTALVNSGAGAVLIDDYVTPVGDITSTAIPNGSWNFRTFADVDSNTGVTELVAKVYTRTSGGVETFLFSATSSEMTTGVKLYELISTQDTFTKASTDRLVVKYYAVSTSGANRAVTVYYEGTTRYTHIETPFDSTSLGTFAQKNVNETITGQWIFQSTTTFATTSMADLTVSGTTTLSGGLSVAGASGLTVLQNGKVGIGTSTPTYKLTVSGDVYADIGSDSTRVIGITGLAPGKTGVFRFGDSSNQLDTTFGGPLNMRSYHGFTINNSFLSSEVARFGTNSNSTESYFTGNLGIGVTDPTVKLDVSGEIKSTGAITAGGAITASGIITGGGGNNSSVTTVASFGSTGSGPNTENRIVLGGDATHKWGAIGARDDGVANEGSLRFSTLVGSSLTEKMAILASGNVGIGTTSPYAKLSVVGDVVAARYVATTTATSTFAGGVQTNLLNVTSVTASSTFANGINLTAGCFSISGTCVGAGSGSGTVNSGTIGQVPYYAGNGTALTATSSLFIATSGNVGIGTTTPSSSLTVTRSMLVDVYDVLQGGSDDITLRAGSGDLSYAGKISILASDMSSNLRLVLDGYTQTTTLSGPNLALDSSAWVITTNGDMSGIKSITGNGNWSIDETGAADFDSLSMSSISINSISFLSASDGLTMSGAFIKMNDGSGSGGGTLFMDGGSIVDAGSIGIGTTSPYAKLSVVGDVVAARYVATTTATSTFAGGIQTNLLNVTSSTATSTFANGINLTSGCFSISGTCVGGSGTGSGTVNSGTTGQIAYYAGNGTAVSGTSTLAVYSSNYSRGLVGLGTTSPMAILSISAMDGNTLVSGSQHAPLALAVYGGNGSQYQGSAGNGGGVVFVTGSGGSGSSIARGGDFIVQTGTGNTSGNISFATGDGVFGNGTAYSSGGISFILGNGATSAISGGASAGAFSILGGNGGGSTNGQNGGVGSSLSFTAGDGGSTSFGPAGNGGAGGSITLTGGSAGTAVAGGNAANGGSITLNGGAKSGAGTDGDIVLANLRGNVGVGDATPSYKLDVTGDIRITGTPYRDGGDIAWQTPSDARLKNVLGVYTKGLEEISKLNIVDFRYKQGNGMNLPTDKVYAGVIAQEVEDIFPEAVSLNQGYLSLNTSPLIWASMNAIKELNMKVDDLNSIFASTTASTTPSAGFVGMVERVMEKLGLMFRDGIALVKGIIVDSVETKSLKTETLCVDDVCISKDQLKELLLDAGGTTLEPPDDPATTTDPGTDEPATTTDDGDTTATSTPETGGGSSATTTPPIDDGEEDSNDTATSTDSSDSTEENSNDDESSNESSTDNSSGDSNMTEPEPDLDDESDPDSVETNQASDEDQTSDAPQSETETANQSN